jgi:hypothetical protein
MNKLLILSGTTNQTYGRSAASTTKNTGLTTDILNAGCVGIYGLVGTDATTAANNGKNCLVGDVAGTGVITGAAFLAGGGDFVQVVQGVNPLTGTPISTHIINPRRVTRITKQVYTSPINEVSFLGWNGTSGSLNLPTITQGSQGTLLSVGVEQNANLQIRNQEDYDTGVLLTTDTGYTISSKLVVQMNSANGYLTQRGFVTGNGTQADFTGTATAILYTKDSTTASFVIQDATNGWVASTGTVAAGDTIGIAHANMKSVTFTATLLGTGAGRTIVTIGSTIYNIADAGTAAQNATAIAAAINAGSQATATVSTADVTIVLNPSSLGAKILVQLTADDAAWTTPTLTVNSTTGDTTNVLHRALATVSAAATFELDRPYRGETGYFLGLTSTSLGTGIVTGTTEWGVKMLILTAGDKYEYAKQGVLQYATLTQREITGAVNPSYGFGTGQSVADMEKLTVVYRGQIDTIDLRMKQLPRYANLATNYDFYTIQYSTLNDRDALEQSVVNLVDVGLAVPVGHAGQAVLETVMKALFSSAVVNF